MQVDGLNCQAHSAKSPQAMTAWGLLERVARGGAAGESGTGDWVGEPAAVWSFAARRTTIVVVPRRLREQLPSPAPTVVDESGVDRGLIRRHLAMSPEERLRALPAALYPALLTLQRADTNSSRRAMGISIALAASRNRQPTMT